MMIWRATQMHLPMLVKLNKFNYLDQIYPTLLNSPNTSIGLKMKIVGHNT